MASSEWEEIPVKTPSHDEWEEIDNSPIAKAHERPWYDISAEGLARGAIDAIPAVGAVGGGILGSGLGPAGSVGGAGLGYAGGKELADVLKNRLLGDTAPSTVPIEQVKRVSKNLLDGANMEMGGQVIGAGAKLAGNALKSAGEGIGRQAEKLAVNATGATGLQASKFADDAGRELLDRKLVKFGDTPEKIATRTANAMESATGDIGSALTGLDAKGVTASADNVVSKLQEKVAQLEKDPSQAGVVRKLRGIIDDIIQTGESNVPVSMAEQTKRGFNKMAGNWLDPEVGQAGKEAYLGYMNEVERAAQAADPALASKFTDAKKTYGLLAPIQEAAERRAFTQGQAPFGGLGDFAAAAAAGGKGVAAKRLVLPRASSSGAVMLDNISKALMRSPRFSQMAAQNPQAFTALASGLSERMQGQSALKAAYNPKQQHSEEQARQSFLDGN